jgi:hypothetical protein
MRRQSFQRLTEAGYPPDGVTFPEGTRCQILGELREVVRPSDGALRWLSVAEMHEGGHYGSVPESHASPDVVDDVVTQVVDASPVDASVFVPEYHHVNPPTPVDPESTPPRSRGRGKGGA